MNYISVLIFAAAPFLFWALDLIRYRLSVKKDKHLQNLRMLKEAQDFYGKLAMERKQQARTE